MHATDVRSGQTGGDRHTAMLSEVVATPAICDPCTLGVALRVPTARGGGPAPSFDVTGIGLGVVDLGPVT